jgi:hypothetical protein
VTEPPRTDAGADAESAGSPKPLDLTPDEWSDLD